VAALKIHPVILCGGSGTRLWPMSRRLLPKQFLPLVSSRTMLQDTLTRLEGLADCASPMVVSNQEHRFLVGEQLAELGQHAALQILEPVGRNTAPAVAVAALQVQSTDANGMLLVLPSDHAVRDVPAFHRAVVAAARIAQGGRLVTFGIQPTEAHTGYGYIELGNPLPNETGAFQIRRFVEKPDEKRAAEYVRSGKFLWNSGMFVLPARQFIEELRALAPEILDAAEKALAGATRDLDFLRLDAKAFGASPSQSIDYAVMEKTKFGAVVRTDMGWSDVGSWSALWDISAKDGQGNATRGDVHVHETTDSYLWAGSHLVYALGVKDLLVVDTDDALLIADRSRAQEVKDIVERLDRQSRTEHISHTRVYRPWGYYETVDGGDRFQVKRLMVKPGQALSLQMHHHRAEHWIVVSGTAKVTRGDEVFVIAENESTYIPLGVKHRLENPGKVPLYLIEVQSGGYLGEDDIVRFDDRYRRS
jgi:mannose-1-phosphate guanylyltransferase / mannose-6-phosphate isomerase